MSSRLVGEERQIRSIIIIIIITIITTTGFGEFFGGKVGGGWWIVAISLIIMFGQHLLCLLLIQFTPCDQGVALHDFV